MPDTNPTESDYPIRVDEYHFPVDAVRDVAERIALGKGEVDEDGYYWLKWEDVNNLQLLSIGEYCSLYFYETNKEDLRCLYWLQPLTQEGVPVSTAFTFKVNTESEEYDHLDVSDFLPDDLSVKSMVLKGKARAGTTGVGSTLVAYNFANCKYDSLSLYNMGVGLDTYSDEDKYFFDSEDFEVGSRLVFNGSSLWISECKFSCPYKHIVLDVKGDFHYEACTFFIDDDLFDGAILYSNTGSELEHLSLFNHGESASSPKTSNLTKVYVSRLRDDFDLDAGTVSLLPKEDTYVEGKEYYFYYPEGDGKWEEIIAKSKEIDYVENGGWSSGWANEWVCLTYDDGQAPPTPEPPEPPTPDYILPPDMVDYPIQIDEANFPNEALRNFVLTEVDLDGDGILSWEEAFACTSVILGVDGGESKSELFDMSNPEVALAGLRWLMPTDDAQGHSHTDLLINGYVVSEGSSSTEVELDLLKLIPFDSIGNLKLDFKSGTLKEGTDDDKTIYSAVKPIITNLGSLGCLSVYIRNAILVTESIDKNFNYWMFNSDDRRKEDLIIVCSPSIDIISCDVRCQGGAAYLYNNTASTRLVTTGTKFNYLLVAECLIEDPLIDLDIKNKVGSIVAHEVNYDGWYKAVKAKKPELAPELMRNPDTPLIVVMEYYYEEGLHFVEDGFKSNHVYSEEDYPILASPIALFNPELFYGLIDVGLPRTGLLTYSFVTSLTNIDTDLYLDVGTSAGGYPVLSNLNILGEGKTYNYQLLNTNTHYSSSQGLGLARFSASDYKGCSVLNIVGDDLHLPNSTTYSRTVLLNSIDSAIREDNSSTEVTLENLNIQSFASLNTPIVDRVTYVKANSVNFYNCYYYAIDGKTRLAVAGNAIDRLFIAYTCPQELYLGSSIVGSKGSANWTKLEENYPYDIEAYATDAVHLSISHGFEEELKLNPDFVFTIFIPYGDLGWSESRSLKNLVEEYPDNVVVEYYELDVPLPVNTSDLDSEVVGDENTIEGIVEDFVPKKGLQEVDYYYIIDEEGNEVKL